MISIYIDWNVMSQMKHGQHPELEAIIADNSRFFKPYSSSHIGDIAASDQDESNRTNIDADLDYISRLSQNYCLCHTGGKTVLQIVAPKDLYDDRQNIQEIVNQLEFQIPSDLPEGPEKEILEAYKAKFDQLQNSQLDTTFRPIFENTETAAVMR